MRVIFESADADGARERDWAVQQMQFAMRRIAWLVPLARLRLADVNGPGGGTDKRCSVELSTAGAGRIVVTSMATDWRPAAHHAIRRAKQRLLRLLRRGRPAAALEGPSSNRGFTRRTAPAGQQS